MAHDKPAPAPAARPAAPVDLLKELQQDVGDRRGLPRAGAALMLAHMRVEIGDAKLRAMSGPDARDYVAAFFHRVPMATSAITMAHPVKLVRVLKMYGIECATAEHYQDELTRVLPPQNVEDLAAMRAVVPR